MTFASSHTTHPNPGTIWTADAEGAIDFLDPRWCLYTGFSLQEATGWGWHNAIFPRDLPDFLKQWRTIVASGEPGEIEARLRRFDAEYRWFLFRLSPLSEASGTASKWCVVNTDIQDRKQAETNSSDERSLHQVINTISTPIWATRSDGVCNFINQRWLDYTGLSRDDATDWGWTSAIHPDDLQGAIEKWKSSLVTGTPFDTEVRIRRHDGVYRWCEVRSEPLRDEEGRISKWYGTHLDIEERKQAQELRASERRLNEIINTIPTNAWSARPDGYCDFLSQRWLDYAGMSAEEGHGWGWGAAVHPDDLPGLAAYWQEHVASGKPGDTEARVRRHDGVYRWFLFVGNPLLDETGNVLRWYGTNIDIEDRKQAEAIRTSERNLWRIVNNIPGFVCVQNTSGEIEDVNQQLLEYLGETLEELQGRKLSDFVHADDRSRVVAVVSHSLSTGIPHSIEFRCRRADGSYRWFQDHTRPVQDVAVHIGGWYVLLTDIEDKKRVEVALHNSERRLNEIINTIPTTAWSTRPDGYCDFLNQRWLNYAGLTEDQAMGWGWSVAIHPDDSQQLENVWISSLQSGAPVDTEARIRRYDGVFRWFLFRANPLRDESGAIIKWYGTNVDIEDRKRAEDELRRSEAGLREAQDELAHVTRVTTMGELAASIAHEINQPIAGVVINGNACLRWLSRLKEDSVNLKEAREALQRIIRDGSRAGEIITRIRALFKKTETAKEPLDLNETIREVIVLARAEINKQRVILQLELPRDLPQVIGDRIQLQQVLLNLILNAIDAMSTVEDRARELVIKTQRDEVGEVVVTVSDTGIGIGPENAEHVFTAFQTTKPGGLGMGLPISRSIVENHSGRLWLTLHEGPGATFRFTLPVQLS